MSSSQHPIALRIEQQVGGASRLLGTVMCLPLIDGIFPALILAGALDDPVGVLEVGLLIFGGSATVAVVLAEMDGTAREQTVAVLGVGAVVIPAAVVEAALAPTIAGLVDLAVFERFAGLVILAIAAKTASARIGELLPRPVVIVALGLLASLDPAGARLVVTVDPGLMLRAGAAAGVGVAFALHLAVFGPWLRDVVDVDRFRFGSAVALGVLPLSLFGLIPGEAPLALAVLGVAFLLAFDPDGAQASNDAPGQDAESGAAPDVVADGDDPDGRLYEHAEAEPGSSTRGVDEDRAPWF